MAAIQLLARLWLAVFAAVAMAQDAPATFNMFPVIGSAGLATNLGWTEDCVVAMNATLGCDSTLYRMAGQLDMYYWSEDNLTALCTESCLSESSSWVGNVGDACVGQTYNVGGKLAPVDTVALRYVEGVTMACLLSNDLPINYTSNSTINDQSLTDDFLGDSNTTVQRNSTTGDPLFDPNDVAPSSNDTVTTVLNITDPAYYVPGPTWCYLESQDWVGVDVDEPDCVANPSNPFCTDASAMTRMANLYYDTTLCSPCFLTIMWYRINSLFLPDTEYSDYLISQFQDIQDICQMQMPETVLRALPDYALAPNTTYLPPGTDPADNSSAPNASSGKCSSQTISASSAGCASLSQQYGVTTGDLQAATGSDDCAVANATCMPSACTLNQVSSGDSCQSLATAYTTTTLNVSTSLFLSWNPNILGLCDNLTAGQYVCSSPPGGTYTLPPPINGTNTDASGQNRGGQGPVGVVPTTNSTAAAPTQAGISPNCTKFAYASSGDSCFGFTQSFSISMADFTTWNPVLGYPDGHTCTTQFWAEYDYCVQVSGSPSSSSSTSSTPTTTTSTLPYPTQSGIISSCNKYQNAISGDYCSLFATDNGITTAQLYAWNSVLGPNGENCATQFQAGVDYCVGVSSSSVTTTSTSPATPTTTSKTSLPYPTQSGIISSCNKFHNAVSGDYCYIFASNNGITTAQLYAWNPILGPNGEDCGTQFQAGVDYCVGVSSAAATTTTTSSVIPTQSGIAANCNRIVVAKIGDYCSLFAQDNSITTAQLYAWNPILGPNGENCSLQFQLGEGYCVSVSS